MQTLSDEAQNRTWPRLSGPARRPRSLALWSIFLSHLRAQSQGAGNGGSGTCSAKTQSALVVAIAPVKGGDELCGIGIDLRQDVRVDVQSEGHGGMSQPSGDDRRVDPLGQSDAGIGVTKPVQGDRWQRCGGNEAHKQRADAL